MPDFPCSPGVTRLTNADSIVGPATNPVRVFDVLVVSGGTGASIVKVRNGNNTSGTIQIQLTTSGVLYVYRLGNHSLYVE